MDMDKTKYISVNSLAKALGVTRDGFAKSMGLEVADDMISINKLRICAIRMLDDVLNIEVKQEREEYLKRFRKALFSNIDRESLK